MRLLALVFGLLTFAPAGLPAQDRDTKVRNDRKAFEGSKHWIYNDLDEGVRVARESGKPLFVAFRCIPCAACQEFDDEVARRDPIIRDLLDAYVCVRIVQANRIDLAHFQHDFDLSFAVYLMSPDLTIYGRYGTRSDRPESEDISLEGLREAMAAALRLHGEYETVKPTLAGKQVRPSRYKTPLDYPGLAGKYGATIDYQGQTARSCLHCHQVREAERRVYREAGEPIPDAVLFPYPDPGVLGLTMDPKERARVKRVAVDSIAARAGILPGDEIFRLAGQPLLSTADLQWVLHHAGATDRLPASVRREGTVRVLTLDLPAGWRRGDISWRPTTWDLRRMALGGLRLEALTEAQRQQAKLPKDGMALRVQHAGEFGAHGVAKRAGIRTGDILVAFDGQQGRMTESELIAYAVQRKRPGDEVAVTIQRGGERTTVRFALQ